MGATFSGRNLEPKLRDNRPLVVEIGDFELADLFLSSSHFMGVGLESGAVECVVVCPTVSDAHAYSQFDNRDGLCCKF